MNSEYIPISATRRALSNQDHRTKREKRSFEGESRVNRMRDILDYELPPIEKHISIDQLTLLLGAEMSQLKLQVPHFYLEHPELEFFDSINRSSRERKITMHCDSIPKILNMKIECLKDYEVIQQIHLNTEQDYEELNAKHQLHNSTLKTRRAHALLKHLFRVREFTIFVSIDLEWNEDRGDKILELGWCFWFGSNKYHNLEQIEPRGKRNLNQHRDIQQVDPRIYTRHYIVEENLRIRNCYSVPDKKDNFLFGESRVANVSEIKAAFFNDLEILKKYGEIRICGHSPRQDCEKMKLLGIYLDQNIEVFDTLELFYAFQKDPRSVKLKTLCEYFKIVVGELHNAGNDAYFTMLAFREMVNYFREKF